MTTINKLNSADSLADGDQIPAWISSDGDTRKASLSLLSEYLQGKLTAGKFQTQYAAPSANGFPIAVQPAVVGADVHVLITPTGALSGGVITLPDSGTAVDKQSILVTTTNALTALTFVASGSNINGAPNALGANSAVEFIYDKITNSRYPVSNSGGTSVFIGPGQSVTLNVPSQFATVQLAKAAIDSWAIASTGLVTIQVADGTLNLASGIDLNHPFGARCRLIGNQTTPDSCVLRTPNPPTFDAITCTDGNKWGFLDGFMVDCAAKATQANNFTAVLASGHASIICGAKMKTNNLYYGIAARDHSYIKCDFANVNNAGDVGIWAFNGSMIDASSATSNNTSDVANALGFGIQAEYGSTINCDNASASGNLIGGIAALSGSAVRAPGSIANGNTGSGYFARDNGTVIAHSGQGNSNTRFGAEFADATARIVGNGLTLTSNTKGPIGPARTVGSGNMLINPEFSVAQFGTNFANPANGDYTLDRWRVSKAAGAGTLPTINVKQNTAAAFGDGVKTCMEMEVTAVGSFGVGGFWLVSQPFANPAQWQGKTITAQFLIWASTAITLTARGEISDSGGQSNSATISSLNTTPRLVTVTRTIDSAASTLSFNLSLFLGNISATASIYVASCQVADDLYPTPVNVTADAQAELIRCLPYAERVLIDTNEALAMADAHTTTSCRTVIHHYPKRRLPLNTEVTVSNPANLALQANNTSIAMSSVGGINAGRKASTINFTAAGLTQGTAGYLRATADGTYVDIRAEV